MDILEINACHFPVLGNKENEKVTTAMQEIRCESILEMNEFCAENRFSISSFLVIVWSVILRQYTESNCLLFGLNDSAFFTFDDSFEEQASYWSHSSIQTCRVSVTSESQILSLLKNRENQIQLEYKGWINHNTGIFFVRKSTINDPVALLDGFNNLDKNGTDYGLLLVLEIDSKVPRLSLLYRTSILSDLHAQNVASTVGKTIEQMLEDPGRKIKDLDLFSLQNKRDVLKWNNRTRDESIHKSVIDIIRQHAFDRPNKPAISSWDGELTYGQLDLVTSQLAAQLQKSGINSGVMVLVSFEKSLWGVVAKLAIMKAGGTYVPIESSQPIQRLRNIIQQVNTNTLVTSEKCSTLLGPFVKNTIIVSKNTVSSLPTVIEVTIPIIDPHSVAYVLFTSGSTGQPKGCMMENAALADVVFHAQSLHIQPESRVLQFASYCFGVSLIEIFCTLTLGATICIPSDYDRLNNLTETVNRMHVTWAILTPSMTNSLNADSLTNLKTLVLAGEAMGSHHLKVWADKVELLQAYGLTEWAGICCVSPPMTACSDIKTIGNSPTANLWLVDPADHNKPAPVGAVAELLVEGPSLARGYLNSLKQASSFVDTPVWLQNICSTYRGRMYKTGDLVQYQPNGTIRYIARKDTQIKIRGMRLELGEIEYHVNRNCVAAERVIAEAAVPANSNGTPILVVFIWSKIYLDEVFDERQPISSLFENPSNRFESDIAAIKYKIRELLPDYMLPSIYIPLRSVPFTITGKADRRKLREAINTLTREQLDGIYDFEKIAVTRPETEIEKKLHFRFAQMLKLDPRKFGVHNSFLRLGGDSIIAMRLANSCQAEALPITVKDILGCETVAKLARCVETAKSNRSVNENIADFSRSPSKSCNLDNSVINRLATLDIFPHDIKDAYLCSPIQEAILFGQARDPEYYRMRIVWEIEPIGDTRQVDLGRLKDSWRKLIVLHPMLRTMFLENVSSDALSIQIILENGIADVPVIKCLDTSSQELSLKDRSICQYMYGRDSLPRMKLYETAAGKVYGLLNISHTLIDAMSVSIMMRDFALLYDDIPVATNRLNYGDYISYLLDLPDAHALEFWTLYLAGFVPGIFPNLASRNQEMDDSTYLRVTTVDLGNPLRYRQFREKTGITLATIFKLAWGLVLHRFTKSNDVCFGYMAAGRDIALEGIEEAVGPFINMLVCRIQMAQDVSLLSCLQKVQSDFICALPHQRVSWAKIRHSLSFAGDAMFNTMVTFPPQTTPRDVVGQTIAISEAGRQDPTEYDIVVEVGVQGDAINCAIKYLAQFCSDKQALDIASSLSLALSEILNRPQQAMKQMKQLSKQTERNIVQGDTDASWAEKAQESLDMPNLQSDILSSEDLKRLESWNKPLPDYGFDFCVHDMIHQRCLDQPNAMALIAWDGGLTYQRLDELSSAVAMMLTSYGVGLETCVPLFFEKSRWAVVAQLGVMKAGGAFVMLDPESPRKRLQNICEDLRAKIIVTSEALSRSTVDLVPQVIIVNDDNASHWHKQSFSHWTPPPVTSTNALYVVFTSGSTGRPKGVVMEHRSFYSNSICHTEALGLTRESRILQFSSYGWDISILDHMSTLLIGGCICIPSEFDRRNRLVETANDFQVNWACTTPSVARLISPVEIPTLKTLVLIGESMTEDIIKTWSTLSTRLINAYGPTECSAISSIQPSVIFGSNPQNIGQAIGGVLWIVDQHNSEKLSPVGAVGELVIEGPHVARGYLDDTEKTTASFITGPPWLSHFRKDENMKFKLYKTGDLVQYNKDGSINYVGRKDTQVKLRGQRIELLEVEYYVRQFFPSAQDVIADIVAFRDGRPSMLICFVCSGLSAAEKMNEDIFMSPSEQFLSEVQTTEVKLNDRVPAYMVPGAFMPLLRMPLTISGKADRRLLRETAASMSLDRFRKYSSIQESRQLPSTEIERTLQQIWAQVLSIAPDDIGRNDNFFRIGGNSIAVMQLLRQCNLIGILITAADIFRFKTIAELAAQLQVKENKPDPRMAVDTWFDLSPIQQMFFEAAPNGYDHFNQSFFLCLKQNFETTDISRALEMIVSRHSMLRARFRQSRDGKWTQAVAKNVQNSYLFEVYRADSREEIDSIISASHRSLDIRKGPVFAANLISSRHNGQNLFLVAHHLVIDFVSWRIVLRNLEDILRHKALPDVAPMSFQAWCQMQAKYSSEKLLPEAAFPEFHRDMIEAATEDYWGINDNDNTFRNVDSYSFNLDEQTTKILFGVANKVFHTQPVEILQAALLHAFVRTFEDRSSPMIFTEGHGREPWQFDTDLTGTVGWFTTIWPTPVTLQPIDDILEAVRRTKDGRRHVPANGWAYFSSRYLNASGRETFKSRGPIEILFNYLGLYQQLERPESLMKIERLSETSVDIGNDMKRFALIDVSAFISESRLQYNFLINRNTKHQANIHRWIRNCEASLRQAAERLVSSSARYTLSDFPLLPLTYDRLDKFMNHTLPQSCLANIEIENIYPCSPVQQGMLLSQARNPQHYQTHFIWRAALSKGWSPIDLDRLKEAWQQVINHHATLRTIFMPVSCEGYFDQVVLKKAMADVNIDDDIDPSPTLDLGPPPRKTIAASDMYTMQPAHKLIIRKTAQGTVFCTLRISHTLFDATSLTIIKRDLMLAYEGRLATLERPLYSNYIAYLQSMIPELAQSYWQRYLKGVEPCYFPLLSDKSVKNNGKKKMSSITIDLTARSALDDFCKSQGVTLTSVFQAAWALVLRCYVAADTVCFGYMGSGRASPVREIQNIVGPCFNMLIARVDMSNSASLLSVLLKIQEDFINGLSHQHYSLADMHHSNNLAGELLFNTVISVRTKMEGKATPRLALVLEDIDGESPTEYPITVDIHVREKTATCLFTYWTFILSEEQATAVVQTFHQALTELLREPSKRVGEVDLVSEENRKEIATWNATAPDEVDRCVHSLIQQRCLEQPNDLAICSWDGSITYRDLESMASIFASHLVRLGVGPEVFVPLCFEKSKWTTVAILGVLKAGGAFVLLDLSDPLSRLQDICRGLQATLVVASTSAANSAAVLAAQVITLGANTHAWEDINTSQISSLVSNPSVTPSNAAYGVFTSGSTGKPKGVVVEHRAFASNAQSQSTSFLLTKKSRVLQFASYAFDASILENLTTLLVGGCICVPSDVDRLNHLAKAMNQLKVNWACLTPSVTRILRSEEVPTLEKLVLGGEAATESDIAQWSGIKVMIAYGPAECAVTCMAQQSITLDSNPRNIGHAHNSAVSWIVDRHNHSKLLPIGAIGELVIEGPILGRGYLEDQAKTNLSFVDQPDWRHNFSTSKYGRLYKTGDLVKYMPDGSMCYMGRKDTQVKLRGQRIELEDVENHVLQCFHNAKGVVAEVIVLRDGSQFQFLAAFLWIESDIDNTKALGDTKRKLILSPTAEHRMTVSRAEIQLRELIPLYMVPSVFFPLTCIPLSRTGKVDRKRLCEEAAALSREQIKAYNASQSEKRMPISEIEKLLQNTCSQLLSLPAEQISMDDNFFHLGGDSVGAMKLAGAMCQHGSQISVKDIFGYPRLSDLITRISDTPNDFVGPAPEFSLLLDDHRQTLIRLIEKQCQVECHEIEDIYPCTALQEGFIALTAKKAGAYIAKFEYQLPKWVDYDRLRKAWKATAAANPILRTRIIQIDAKSCFQAVIRDDLTCQIWANDEDYNTHRSTAFEVGKQLLRIGVIKQPDESSNCTFILVIHHALYDGWSLPLILSQVEAAYRGEKLHSKPFNSFIKYILQSDPASKQFWKREFAGIDATVFPSLPCVGYEPAPSKIITHCIPHRHSTSSNLTISTKLRLAWAILISKYTDSSDVVFGVTVTGRGVPVLKIEQLTGPTLATIPLRIQLDDKKTISENLEQIQDRYLSLMPFEHAGLQNISRMGAEAEIACQFQSLLVIQPNQSDIPLNIFERCGEASSYGGFNTYAITLNCQLSPEMIEIHMIFDGQIIDEVQARIILRQLDHITQEITNEPNKPITAIHICPKDRLQLERWNGELPRAVDSCVHELIHERCSAQPDAPAVCAWDGNFTYREANELSSNLAWHLSRQNISSEMFVPILFEKSRWVVIALLGVLKTGAAFVLLDSSHPVQRLREICRDVGAQSIISSAQNAEIAANLAPQVTKIGEDMTIRITNSTSCWLATSVSPDNAAYAIFTSGSTGKPKGAIIDHRSFSTSAKAHSVALHIDSGSRVLQFASHAFDATMAEIMTTLIVGGCVCIPSDTERKNNIPKAIAKMNVNWAFLTPSVARILQPEQLPSLRTLILGGEILSAIDIKSWYDKLRLILSYGPTECTVYCAATGPQGSFGSPQNLGHFFGCAPWIVDHNDYHKLAPIGAIGELLIEGPIVSRGYINDPLRTAAAFVEPPSWLLSLRGGRKARLYKTGDLVRYAADGSIHFVGRKDTQVKLRGQRIELGEIEYHTLRAFPRAKAVTAEIIAASENARAASLFAFIWQECEDDEHIETDERIMRDLFYPPSEQFRSDTRVASSKLQNLLPAYFVPTVFLPLSYLPLTKTGKTDRKLLRTKAALVSREDIEEYGVAKVDKCMPTTAMGIKLQCLLARVLNIPQASIGLDDNFFHLGGDSIGAMMLVGIAQQEGIELSVPDIFEHPTLSELAIISEEISAEECGNKERARPSRYSLLNVTEPEKALDGIAAGRPFETHDIVDVLPTTEFQREYIYSQECSYFIIEALGLVDLQRLKEAIQSLVRKYATLRTVFVPFNNTIVQVILNHIDIKLLELSTNDELIPFAESICQQDAVVPVSFGASYFQPTLISGNQHLHVLILRLSHAQYDAISMPFLYKDLSAAYEGAQLLPEITSYSDYMTCRAQQNSLQAFQFWEEILQGSSMTYLDPTALGGQKEGHTEVAITVNRTIPNPRIPQGITMATVHKAAWSLVLAHWTQQRDLVFGQVGNGRNVSLKGVDTTFGPCINIVPVRVTLQPNWTVSDLFEQVQNQHFRATAFETVDLGDIIANSTSWSRGTRFGTVAQHQNIALNPKFPLGGVECTTRVYHPNHLSKDLYVISIPEGDQLTIHMFASSKMLDQDAANRILGELCDMVLDLAAHPHMPLSEIL